MIMGMAATLTKFPPMGKKTNQDTDKKPVRTGRALSIWIDDDVWAAFEEYLSTFPFKPKYTQAIEHAMKEFLRKEGFWPPKR